MPVGTSVVRLLRRESCTCGEVGWLPTHWVGAEEGAFKKLREVGSLTAGGNHFCQVRVGQLSRYSHVLLLPLGVPPMPAPAVPHTKSFPRQWSLGGVHHSSHLH